MPSDPPKGIVFVLGTRPDDTLQPLELRRPHRVCRLPNLERNDFDLILEHRGIKLSAFLTDQFYQAMQGNALYLDLVAKELAQADAASPEDIIQRVADNPDNLFSISMARLKRNKQEWYTLLKPILGLLLIAQAPFKRQHLKQILKKDDEQVRDALTRLGGLVSTDGQDRCSLFHLKLRDYLRRDIFPKDEEESLHEIMVRWCESIDISGIWKDEKLNVLKQEQYEYIKLYYIVHLYQAKEWQRLFAVLDDKSYGQTKMKCDPMRRSYILDLDIGRNAASWEGWTVNEGITYLPSLWRYSLLQCSLASRANAYTKDAFKVLLLLERDREAVELAELLTKPDYKAEIQRKLVWMRHEFGRWSFSMMLALLTGYGYRM